MWWILAIALVHASRRAVGPCSSWTADSRHSAPASTLFKPLPTVPDLRTRDALAAAIGSFLPQLDNTAQLLVGVPQEQTDLWTPVLDAWSRRGRRTDCGLLFARPRVSGRIRRWPGLKCSRRKRPGNCGCGPMRTWWRPRVLEELPQRAGGASGGGGRDRRMESDPRIIRPAGGTRSSSMWSSSGSLLLGRLGPVPLTLVRRSSFARRISGSASRGRNWGKSRR